MTDHPASTYETLATLGEIVDQHIEAGRPASAVLTRRMRFLDRVFDRIRVDLGVLKADIEIAVEMQPLKYTAIALAAGIVGGTLLRLSLSRRRF